MKDIVEPGTLRKLQAVRHSAHAFQDPERPGVTRPELVLGAGVQRLRSAVK